MSLFCFAGPGIPSIDHAYETLCEALRAWHKGFLALKEVKACHMKSLLEMRVARHQLAKDHQEVMRCCITCHYMSSCLLQSVLHHLDAWHDCFWQMIHRSSQLCLLLQLNTATFVRMPDIHRLDRKGRNRGAGESTGVNSFCVKLDWKSVEKLHVSKACANTRIAAFDCKRFLIPPLHCHVLDISARIS